MTRFLLAFLIFAAPAFAHHAKTGWPYPWECCSDRDCWIMGLPEGHEPEPQFVDGYWLLHDGTRIPDKEARPSPDGLFHVCRHGGKPEGSVIKPPEKPICLWVPRGAS